MKHKLSWRVRKISESNQSLKLDCGCSYSYMDKDKTILRYCEQHQEEYTELNKQIFEATGRPLRVSDLKR